MNKKVLIIGSFLIGLSLLLHTRVGAITLPAEITLNSGNNIPLTVEISTQIVDKTILAIEENKSSPLYIYIDSPGGEVISGFRLVTYLQHTKKDIICIAHYAASMAHAILESCPVRLGTPDNVLLQHHAAMTTEGTATELLGQLKILKGLELLLDTLEAERIGILLPEFQEKVNHPFITFGEESVKMHLLDGITTVYCTPELYAAKRTIMINGPFGPLKGQTSACPLISTPDVSE